MSWIVQHRNIEGTGPSTQYAYGEQASTPASSSRFTSFGQSVRDRCTKISPFFRQTIRDPSEAYPSCSRYFKSKTPSPSPYTSTQNTLEKEAIGIPASCNTSISSADSSRINLPPYSTRRQYLESSAASAPSPDPTWEHEKSNSQTHSYDAPSKTQSTGKKSSCWWSLSGQVL